MRRRAGCGHGRRGRPAILLNQEGVYATTDAVDPVRLINALPTISRDDGTTCQQSCIETGTERSLVHFIRCTGALPSQDPEAPRDLISAFIGGLTAIFA